MKTTQITESLSNLTVGDSVDLNGRAYTVEAVTDLSSLKRLSEILVASYTLRGKRGGAKGLEVKRSGGAFMVSLSGGRCQDVFAVD